MNKITIDIEEYQELVRQANLALIDPMTGLYNRRGLERRFNELMSNMSRDRYYDAQNIWMICIDINGLKTINTRYGYTIGDRVIQKVGECLGDNFRDHDIVARGTGDEFFILCARSIGDSTSLDYGILDDRIRYVNSIISRYAATEEGIILSDDEVRLGIHWGIGNNELALTRVEELIEIADRDLRSRR